MKSLKFPVKKVLSLLLLSALCLGVLCLPAGADECSSNVDSLSCGAAVSCATYGSAVGVVISGSHAYVAAYEAGLSVVDISVPASPVFLDSCETPGEAHGVAISGHYAFVPDYLAGFTVVDIANPANPQLVVNVRREGDQSYAVALSGNYAYVANGNLGLSVYDVSVPSNPIYVTSLDTDGSARAVVISGSYAYVGDCEPGLVVVDISNPLSPVKVGGCDTPGNAQWVALSGNYAYVADYNHGLAVVDISDVAHPSVVASAETPDLAWGVYLSSHYAFVADNASGLHLFDIANPLLPVQVDSCDTPGLAMGVVVSVDYAYVADERQGLRVIPIHYAPMAATVDFDPNTLNLKSRGRWVTCYVELLDGCDVADVDIASVMLNGSVHAEESPSSIGDYDSDGLPDLMVKFDRSAVGAILTIGQNVEITVTGNVGSQLFSGTDYIRVINPPVIPPKGGRGTSTLEAVTLELHPNPFNPSVGIAYGVPAPAWVVVEIIGVDGRLVRTLEDGQREAGLYIVDWDGKDGAGRTVSSGLYFCRLMVGDTVLTKKLTLLR
jgi:hypothetical protein